MPFLEVRCRAKALPKIEGGTTSCHLDFLPKTQMQNGCLALGEWLKAIRQVPFAWPCCVKAPGKGGRL